MLSSDFFVRNRSALKAQLEKGPIVLSAHAQMQRSADATFAFVQEPHFWWLTGISEANWKLVIDESHSYLIAPQLEEVYVTFNGGISASQALEVSGVDAVISEHEYQELLERLMKKHQRAYTLLKNPSISRDEFVLNPAPAQLQRYLKRQFKEIVDCRPALGRLRALKQPEEIKYIQAAITTTIAGFRHVKEALDELTHEYEVEAILNKTFRYTGSGGHAYDPIVASGRNACTLHYNANNDSLEPGTLLLIDAGAQVSGYAADVTRTYAVGAPTKRQVEIHAAVEYAHQSIIKLIQPGLALNEYQLRTNEIMKDALQKVGLLTDRNDEKTYRKYFPHAISHGLGLDVHESLGGFGEFKAGMVLTVEPGIYIPEEGIGVRIEDDILVTETGNKNLSADLPTSL